MENRILTKEELAKHIKWSGCPTECDGNMHVGKTCSYIIGEISELNLRLKFDGHRSTMKNRQVVLDTIYDLYLKY